MRLDEKMRSYEAIETSRRTMPLLPVIVRLDGQRFTKFTKGMKKPFDQFFSICMDEVTNILMEETNAVFGYTQSDEISLLLYSPDYESKLHYDGKIQKLVSSLASLTSVEFYSSIRVMGGIPFKPTFDCRVFTVPTTEEACQYFISREIDAERNSVQMLARHHFSHKECDGKTCEQMKDMLRTKEIKWESLPSRFSRGTLYQKTYLLKKFSSTELEKLPEKHEARKNPELEYQRKEIRTLENTRFCDVMNKLAVVLKGSDPIGYPGKKEK